MHKLKWHETIKKYIQTNYGFKSNQINYNYDYSTYQSDVCYI